MKFAIAALALPALAIAALAHASGPAELSLTRTTYLGGAYYDVAIGITEAPDHTLYVVGLTNSHDFPVSDNAAQRSYGGGIGDMFVARFSANLKRLLAATYVGGNADDGAYAIAYDTANHFVYVVGFTYSADFPGTAGKAQPDYAGGGDTVVVRLSPDLSRMEATYLGGSGDDTPDTSFQYAARVAAIGISPLNGGIYVAGTTDSVDFPHTAFGAQRHIGGGRDSFVAILTPNLRRLVQATYLGGSGEDQLSAMTFDGTGDVYVAGLTRSSDFPATSGGVQSALKGVQDSFVAALPPNLARFTGATYLGGSGGDGAVSLAMDTFDDELYVLGDTRSLDFPGTALGAQPQYAGNGDAYVAALSTDLSIEYAATYLGGSAQDSGRPAIAVSPADGSIYVAGTTESVDFPNTVGGVQPQYPGGTYATYVTHLTDDLSQNLQSTYLGGSSSHTGAHALCIEPAAFHVYVASGTGATDLPNTSDAYDPTFNGGSRDAAVSIFNPTLTP